MAREKKTVLITGASGIVGKATLKELGNYAEILDVKAGTRDPFGNAALKDLAPNVTVVAADVHDLQVALTGVDYIFVIPPSAEDRGEIVEEIIKSAKTAGVSLLLLLSVDIAPNTIFGNQYSKMVAAAQASGLPTVILNANTFMDNIVFCSKLTVIKEQSIVSEPFRGDSAHGLICVEDIGAIAAKILSDPSPHVGKTYPICTPPICYDDVVRAISSTLGRTITYKQMPYKLWRSFMGEFCPEWLVNGISEIYELVDAHSPIMTPPDGPSNFEKILGRPPKTIEEFINSKADLFE